MQDLQIRLRYLYLQWFNKQASEQEREELFVMLSGSSTNELSPLMKQAWLTFNDAKSNLDVNLLADRILADHPSKIPEPVVIPIVHRVHFLRTAWFKFAAAIIILFGTGAYLWNYSLKKTSNTATIKPSSNDIKPGGQRAVLTLADGSQIILDSAANGQLAVQNGSEVVKRDGQVIYGSSPIPSNGGVDPTAGNPNISNSSVGAGVGYNTMSTPRGGQYQLTLSDGTRVWLNASSSITYPTIFTKSTREVQITGEVYFEVKADKEKPFIVRHVPFEKEGQGHLSPAGGSGSRLRRDEAEGGFEIIVLGTSFNVNTYPDEPLKTSLLEGSIKINNKLIQPGQAYMNGKIITTDITQDIAWKNGLFNFHRMNIRQVMKQLARWYNIEVEYEGPAPQLQFYGKMERNLNLSQVLKLLEESGVKFSIEGTKITVKK